MLVRTISIALVAGFLSGLFLFLVQRSTTLPLIRIAEEYEHASSGSPESAPDDETFGKEPLRSAATLLADIAVAVGFGLILTGVYALTGKWGWRSGLLLGAGGFLVFHLGPALVVPPALPGMTVASLSMRQLGWVIAAGSTAAGLASFFVFNGAARLLGILLLLLPPVLFHSLLSIPPATTSSPALAALEQTFVVRTLANALPSWLLLGIISGYLFGKASQRRH